MDIILTMPREYGYDHLLDKIYSANHGFEVWWNMKRIPKKLEEGDRLFVVFDGRIEVKFQIETIDKENGRLYLCNAENIEPPIKMKGFRGFRYKKEVKTDGRNKRNRYFFKNR